MPRYNLNQDDVDIIVSALHEKAEQSWNPKDQQRIRRLIMRLRGKIDALSKNVNTQLIEKQEPIQIEQPYFHDDSVWNYYSKKD